jgi:Family of unknown function (DUF5990)
MRARVLPVQCPAAERGCQTTAGNVVSTPNKHSAKTLPLRITVVDPPPNVLWALQVGQDELIKPTSITKTGITFDFTVEVVEDSSATGFRLRGPPVQGRPGERFIYLCIGTYAGQVDTPFRRRAKIRLEGISRKLLTAVKAKRSKILEAQFGGTDSKGGPTCATVTLLGKGWHIA